MIFSLVCHIKPEAILTLVSILPMQYIQVEDQKIPALGLGTYQLKGKTAEEVIERAFDIGYRHIDTAQLYDNEKEVGRAIKDSGLKRKSLFVTTKVWWTKLKKSDDFEKSVEKSLKKLKLDYVDLLLIHWPHPSLSLKTYIPELMRMQEMGLTKHIGVSNFTPSMVEKSIALGANIINNQVEYHPMLDQSKLLKTIRKHKMSLTAYSPVAQGQVGDEPELMRIAEKYDKSPFQIALRWLIQQEGVMAIPRTKSKKNLKKNFNIFDFELSKKDMAAIFALNAQNKRLVDPEWGPEWDKA